MVPAVQTLQTAVGSVVAPVLLGRVPAATHEEVLLRVHSQAQRLVLVADLGRHVLILQQHMQSSLS